MLILSCIFWLLKPYYLCGSFLVLMYNIFNNCKEKKSKKNPCQETYVKAECIRIFMLKYFRSALAIQKNNWNLGNVVKKFHFNKKKYIKKENTVKVIQANLIFFYNENLREISS